VLATRSAGSLTTLLWRVLLSLVVEACEELWVLASISFLHDWSIDERDCFEWAQT
jgi:hypothetical protein